MDTAPGWYKVAVVMALVLNPVLLLTTGPAVASWVILIEFLCVLALSNLCYPLFPGGLLAIEVLVLKMTSLEAVMKEIHGNIDVIMLLIFLVPAVYFLNPLLTWLFMRLFSFTKEKIVLSLVFLFAGAFLAAWLDALTVVAVMITSCMAAKEILSSAMTETSQEKEEFDGFLRNLLMHGAVGTAIGGVTTLIGQPQNILIGHYAGWNFADFYLKMAHFSIPLQVAAIVLCWSMERFRVKAFGFGYQFPERIALTLDRQVKERLSSEGSLHQARLITMALIFVCFMFALAFQIAPIGIIGLGLLIALPVLTGQTEEHQLGKAFHDSLPFTALLVVFFIIVAMLETQHLFSPIMDMALGMQQKGQLYAFFTASGILSSVSDNVFVASIYVHQAYNAFAQNIVDRAQFDSLCLVINAGTNIFSILTPNGQAAFLFLLTSALARKIELSYGRMFLMSLPYAVVLIALSYVMI